MKKLITLLFLLAFISGLSSAQIVNIPDNGFLNKLIDLGIDSDGDSLISTAEAEAVVTLNLERCWDWDFTGLEAFINLDTLRIYTGEWNTLDLSKITSIRYLDLRITVFHSLKLPHHSALTYCRFNDMIGGILDLSNNSSLKYICWSWCYTNFNSINVEGCDSLVEIGYVLGFFPSINASGCKSLKSIKSENWYSENLSYLNVDGCSSLQELHIGGSSLTNLNISDCDSLKEINIDNCKSLSQVCVWTMPFPPEGVIIDTTGSPNVYFTTECIYNSAISDTIITLKAAANSTATFSITSSTDWMISDLPSWLSASTIYGSGDSTITLTAQENTLSEPRTDTITVSGIGVSHQTIIVTQCSNAAVLNVSETSLSLEAEADSKAKFDITSNIDWTIWGMDSWLSADITSGNTDATITLTAQENTLSEPRTDTIAVSCNCVSDQTIIVTQSGNTISVSNLKNSNIKIYPNPTNHALHIEGLQKHTKGSIYNGNGRIINTSTISDNNAEINVSELPAGLYILKLDVDDRVVVKKFVKE